MDRKPERVNKEREVVKKDEQEVTKFAFCILKM